MDPVSLLITLSVLGVVGLGLMAVAVAKTVKYHGLGKQSWAPPAVGIEKAGRQNDWSRCGCGSST